MTHQMSCSNRPWTLNWGNFSKSRHPSHSSHTWGSGESEEWPRIYLQPIHSCNRIHIGLTDTFISIADKEQKAKRAPALSVNPAGSHLQVSKPNLHASSTWFLLAKVSCSSLQASSASVKFSCRVVFLLTSVTPIILHGPEIESSAKKSQRPSVFCFPCF